MAQKPVSVVMVGIRGYGLALLGPLLDAEDKSQFRLVGAVARNPDKCERLGDLQKQGVAIYPSLEDFYAADSCDLVIISTPIHLHLPQTKVALENGSHVLCEKPLTPTIQEAKQMIEARDKSGKRVAIGYNWSFTKTIGDLKRDIQAGLFGAAKRLRTMTLWPRFEGYYNRNTWSGIMRDSEGNWVLDSPINNATAHYLHNMFYVLGETIDTSAMPVDVEAELYRGRKTENFDTGAMRCHTATGAEILFYSTHAVEKQNGPVFCFEFEKAEIRYNGQESPDIVAYFKDGSTKNYGSADEDQDQKIWEVIACINSGAPMACGIEAASAQTLALNGAHDSMPEIVDLPESIIKVTDEADGDKSIWAEGLGEVFEKCYEDGVLPSEAGVPWSKAGRKIDLREYQGFPGGKG